jgi:DNA-directed RNA polymerase specialized sigma24 family protein
MLRVLADYDRSRRRAKRDVVTVHLSLGALGRRGIAEPPAAEIPRVESALAALEDLEPRAGRIAKLRLLWDLEVDEIAQVLGISRSTVDRDWRFARAWLRSRLS